MMAWHCVSARLRFILQDAWIGVYWNHDDEHGDPALRLDVYVCVLPTLPLHLMFLRGPIWDQWRRDRARWALARKELR